ncbi:MAG: ABC transporter permease subunit [Eubacteriales bacterium]|nr:ABC transporter permease subunit [Eubacteriales bacterium]
MQKKVLKNTGIALFWLLLWQLAAVLLDNDILLVGPVRMLRVLVSMMRERAFYAAVASSLLRIGSGFLLAACAGVLFGAAASFCPFLASLLMPPVALMKSIPVASFVILAIIWLGGTQNLSVFVSFVVVFPMVYLSTISGIASTDKKLLEMAKVFRAGRLRMWRYIYLPALLPYLLNCFRTALAMAWKSGVAAELIGQPRGTIGGNLYQAKIFLDTPALFAWTFTIIAVSFLFEKLVLKLMERIMGRRALL